MSGQDPGRSCWVAGHRAPLWNDVEYVWDDRRLLEFTARLPSRQEVAWPVSPAESQLSGPLDFCVSRLGMPLLDFLVVSADGSWGAREAGEL